MVEAASLVGTDETLEVQTLRFTFEMSVKSLRSQVRAATSWVVLWTLVNAHKYMALERGHDVIELCGHCRGAEAIDEQRYIVGCYKGRGFVDRAQERRNFPQTQRSSPEFVTLCKLGTLSCIQLVEFTTDVPKVPLKIFLHGTSFAIPFRALI